MPTVPLMFTAQQVTVMSATPQTANSSGVLSSGTAIDLHTLGIFDYFDVNLDPGLIELSPSDALIENYQKTKQTFTATLAQIERAGKSGDLLTIAAGFDYLRIAGAAAAPGGTAVKTLVVIGSVGSVGTGFRAGRNVTTLEIRPCGIAPQWQASPTI